MQWFKTTEAKSFTTKKELPEICLLWTGQDCCANFHAQCTVVCRIVCRLLILVHKWQFTGYG